MPVRTQEASPTQKTIHYPPGYRVEEAYMYGPRYFLRASSSPRAGKPSEMEGGKGIAWSIQLCFEITAFSLQPVSEYSTFVLEQWGFS